VNDRSVDPRTLAGDPIAYAARIKAQEELMQAAEAALRWLYDRRAHLPEELLDHREARHRKALREAVRRVREGEIPQTPDPQDFPTEADYELAVAIHQEEVRMGRAMSQGEREAFGEGYHRQDLGDAEFSRAMGLPSEAEDAGDENGRS
jgi:hypothetical protein